MRKLVDVDFPEAERSGGLSSNTRPSTPAGSTWLRSRSACSKANVSIAALLFFLAVAYAACGSLVAIVLGRPLIKLNNDQLDKEASFRSALIHIRQNAEPIMLARREERQTARLLDRHRRKTAFATALACTSLYFPRRQSPPNQSRFFTGE
jgi:ABC transporter transmembrane region 2